MDELFRRYLRNNNDDFQQFLQMTDIVRLLAQDDRLQHYLLQIDCPTLVKSEGAVRRTRGVMLELFFPEDYQCHAAGKEVITLLTEDIFLPQVRSSCICVGALYPGMVASRVTEAVYSILTGQRFNLASVLNTEAAAWVRTHLDEMPLTRLPIFRAGHSAISPDGRGV